MALITFKKNNDNVGWAFYSIIGFLVAYIVIAGHLMWSSDMLGDEMVRSENGFKLLLGYALTMGLLLTYYSMVFSGYGYNKGNCNSVEKKKKLIFTTLGFAVSFVPFAWLYFFNSNLIGAGLQQTVYLAMKGVAVILCGILVYKWFSRDKDYTKDEEDVVGESLLELLFAYGCMAGIIYNVMFVLT